MDVNGSCISIPRRVRVSRSCTIKNGLILLFGAFLFAPCSCSIRGVSGSFAVDTQGKIDGKCKQCKDEATDRVFHLIDSQKCRHTGCNKFPSYGFEMEGKKRCCAQHAAKGMTSLLKKCVFVGCGKTASYGFAGLARTRCGQHKENGMGGPSRRKTKRPRVVPQPRISATAVGVAQAAFVEARAPAADSSISPGERLEMTSEVEPTSGAVQGVGRMSVLVSTIEAAGVQECEVGRGQRVDTCPESSREGELVRAGARTGVAMNTSLCSEPEAHVAVTLAYTMTMVSADTEEIHVPNVHVDRWTLSPA